MANGTLLRPFSQAIMEACLKASNEVNAETCASNPDFKKIYDSQMEFRNDENLWWQVAEHSHEGSCGAIARLSAMRSIGPRKSRSAVYSPAHRAQPRRVCSSSRKQRFFNSVCMSVTC